MEDELRAAVNEYRLQMAAVEQLLAAEPDNAEAEEVYGQLQGALQYTLAALQQVDEQVDEHKTERHTQPEKAGGAESPTAQASYLTLGTRSGAAAPGTTATAGAAAPRHRGGAVNNARMHPANRYYRQEPDFGALARQYDELRPYVTIDAAGRGHLDTTSWEATRALTACLLRHDFGLRWWLPVGQLVPPVTNRANYIHWINDLLDLSSPGDGPIRGMDIGCGANFIYCLLGGVLYGWTMVGVDVTQVSVQCCQKLIDDNPEVGPLLQVRDLSHLHPELQCPQASVLAATEAGGESPRGRKRQARDQDPEGTEGLQQDPQQAVVAAGQEDGREGPDAVAVNVAGKAVGAVDGGEEAVAEMEPGGFGGNDQGILRPAFVDDKETFAFTMCNPPFFESMQEAAQNPNTAFGGTAAEMVCPGGELAFVLRMLVDSEELRGRVHWFTTMVGKKSTLKALKRELHARHVTALRSTELAQGKTLRWAVAWSWQVDPNKASQPLRRLDALPAAGAAATAESEAAVAGREAMVGKAGASDRAQQPSAPSLAAAGMAALPRRHVSFTVLQMGSTASLAILQRLVRLLTEMGCQSLQVDAAAWTVSWPLQVGPFAASSAGQQGPSGSAAQPRGEAQPGSGSWASNITARLRIAQQQRGRVEVMATIPNTAPEAAARAFAGLMSTLESALGK